MRTVKLAVSLTLPLLAQACGGPTPESSSALATRAAALTTAASRGCTFSLSYDLRMMPRPTYYPLITRQASASCPWPGASLELGETHDPPKLSIAANDLGVAVSYTDRYSPSGSAGVHLKVLHVAPDTLTVVRGTELISVMNYRASTISSGELSLRTDATGTALRVQGEKSGSFTYPGDADDGRYYTATYPNFFTSTEAATLVSSDTAPEEHWADTGSLTTARAGHTATLLNATGDVLLVSGDSAEIHNPYTHVSRSAGTPIIQHAQHTATALASGQVLVAGGAQGTMKRSSSELYDPATDAWSYAAEMHTPRALHTATLLDSGQVLVVGGESTQADTDSAELYDPDTNTWNNVAPLPSPRSRHTATLLYSGKVLVTGGHSPSSSAIQDARLYDPATNAWSTAGALSLGRAGHLAVQLYSGKVLILGGGSDVVDVYDPYSLTPWTQDPELAQGGSATSATRLYSGEVLVTHATGQASLYDPSTNAWMSAGNLSAPRQGHTATLLHTGQVLVTGGATAGVPSTTVQTYTH